VGCTFQNQWEKDDEAEERLLQDVEMQIKYEQDLITREEIGREPMGGEEDLVDYEIRIGMNIGTAAFERTQRDLVYGVQLEC